MYILHLKDRCNKRILQNVIYGHLDVYCTILTLEIIFLIMQETTKL